MPYTPHDNQYDKHYDKQSHVPIGLEQGQHDKHYDKQYDSKGHKKSPSSDGLLRSIKKGS